MRWWNCWNPPANEVCAGQEVLNLFTAMVFVHDLKVGKTPGDKHVHSGAMVRVEGHLTMLVDSHPLCEYRKWVAMRFRGSIERLVTLHD